MITRENLDNFAKHAPPALKPKAVPPTTKGRGIGESPDKLRAYLKAHGVTVSKIKAGRDGATILILDGCPMNPEHGSGSDTAVVLRTDGLIGFECKHNSCAQYTWADVRAKIDPEHGRTTMARDSQTDWEPPLPFGRFVLPSFPLEAIPEQLCAFCAFCAEVAESFQVPPDLPALLALAVSGAALAKRVEVHVRGDHYEPVNVFVVVAMEPSERKSAVFRAVSAPLVEFEREEMERLGPEVERRQTERVILLKALQEAQSQAAKAKKSEERGDAQQRAQELTAELRETPAIALPRFIADDATPEALSKLLAEQGGRIALLSPEGDVFDLMAGRYSPTGVPNLGVYLKGHAGDDHRVDRVSKDRAPEYVRRPALTVGLAVQPEVLRGLMEKRGFRGRGLLGRFIYALPNSLLGHRKLNAAPVSQATREGFACLIRAALRLAPVLDENGVEHPHIIRVGAEALTELDRFAADVERELRDGGSFAAMRDWAGKLVGAVCRIAGIFHGLKHAPSRDPGEHPLDTEAMLCAMAIGEYAITHARAAYFEMGADPAIGLARRVLTWLAEERPAEFSRRDVFNQLRGTVHKVDEVDEPLRLLEAHSYIRERQTERSGPGRKPSKRYEVNPYFYAQNAHNTQNSTCACDSVHSPYSGPGIRP
jgi:hypothetical protein